jgi:hypothetical protein
MGRRRPTSDAVTAAETEIETDTETDGAAVKLGRYEVTCKRIRAEVWHLDGTHRLARYRQEWPDFWEAVDDMVALLDEDDPPRPLPTSTNIDPC